MLLRKIIFVSLLLSLAHVSFAADDSLQKAKVLEIVREEKTTILQEIGKSIDILTQTLAIEIITGPEKGKTLQIENDYIRLKKSDKFFIEKSASQTGEELYVVRERDRQVPISVLLLLFAGAILWFGGRQGLRSLLSLVIGFLVIIYFLLPLLTKGYSPIIVSISFASIILFFAIYFTHGFNRESAVAFSGTICAVILTGLLAFFSVFLMDLTGYSSEESIFLSVENIATLDFRGLLLGGILIGVLGILDDIAVTQAAVVSEIYKSAPHLTKKEVFKKAMRVGREHVSALVNTLVLAYTGASLPILLLISNYDYPFGFVLSQELFSTEIVRTIVGSIGLVLAVPITTFFAVLFLKEYKGKNAPENRMHLS